MNIIKSFVLYDVIGSFVYNSCVFVDPHSLSGSPGDYQRIGGLRVDECATYGCLFELTIQLAIIMVGKQILNNVQELSLPYVD